MKYIVGIAKKIEVKETIDAQGRQAVAQAIARKTGIPLGPDEVNKSKEQILWIYDKSGELIFEC